MFRFLIDNFPLMPREGHLLFAVGQKVGKNPIAASAALDGSAEGWPVLPAPAEAKKKVNGGAVLWPK